MDLHKTFACTHTGPTHTAKPFDHGNTTTQYAILILVDADGTNWDSDKLKYDMGNAEGLAQQEEAGRPIPFITVDMDGDKPGLFSVTDEAKEALACIEGPLAVGVCLCVQCSFVCIFVCHPHLDRCVRVDAID